jgi:C4-dicarboxylate-specific signal transduction histidine kinase
MAHELRQPLAAVRNFSEAAIRLLRDDAGQNREQIADALATIFVQAGRAQQMTQCVSTFVRAAGNAWEKFDVWEVIREAAVLLDFEADRASVAVQFPENPPPALVCGNRVEIEQVLVNLLHNAIESVAACPEGPRRITLRIVPADGAHRIEVTDTGGGIRREDEAKLFQRFFTTKPRGLGLGLAVSRAIAESHGGRVWAASSAARGATFCLTLPVAASDQMSTG